MKPDTLRVRAGARCLMIAATCAAVAAACGSTPAPSGAGASVPAPAPKVSLEITVSTKPGVPAKHWTLDCDPPGGTHPDPAAACAILLKAKNPFAPPPKGIMCPMIRVGSKSARVTGIYFGKKIDITLIEGGCYMGQWEQIGQIFN